MLQINKHINTFFNIRIIISRKLGILILVLSKLRGTNLQKEVERYNYLKYGSNQKIITGHYCIINK